MRQTTEKKTKTIDTADDIRSLNSRASSLYFSAPDQTLDLASRARDAALRLGYRRELAESLRLIGLTKWIHGRYSQSQTLFQAALELFQEHDDRTGIALSLYNLAGVFVYQGAYHQALKNYYRALHIHEDTGNISETAAAYNGIGNVYYQQDEYTAASKYYEKCRQLAVSADDRFNEAMALGNLGNIRLVSGDIGEAHHLYNTSLKIRKEINDRIGEAMMYLNIGYVYSERQEYAQALPYYQLSLDIRSELNHTIGIISACSSIGEVLTRLREYPRAAAHLFRGLRLAEGIHARHSEMDACLRLSRLFETRAKYKNALHYHRRAGRLKDEIFTEKSNAAIAEMRVRFETDQMEKLSYTDQLTGLSNRRHMQAEIREMILEQRSSGTPFTVLMIDLDNFKNINDLYGHDAGDAVLREVADIFQTSLRKIDIKSRWGGEEFVILLPHTSIENARNIGEKLLQKVRSAEVSHEAHTIHVTFSCGIASCGDDSTAETLIKEADDALYLAKNSGRNRIITYSDIDSFDEVAQ